MKLRQALSWHRSRNPPGHCCRLYRRQIVFHDRLFRCRQPQNISASALLNLSVQTIEPLRAVLTVIFNRLWAETSRIPSTLMIPFRSRIPKTGVFPATPRPRLPLRLPPKQDIQFDLASHEQIRIQLGQNRKPQDSHRLEHDRITQPDLLSNSSGGKLHFKEFSVSDLLQLPFSIIGYLANRARYISVTHNLHC